MAILALFVAACALVTVSHSFKVNGKATLNGQQATFLGKFCYDFKHTTNFTTMPPTGAVDYEFSGLSANTKDYWFIMFDNDNHNKFRNDKSLTCADWVSGGIANLKNRVTTDPFVSLTKLKEHLFPRWWYAFLINCNASQTPSQDVSYKIHFYQLDETQWNMEFGVNVNGLNSMYLFFSIFYTLVTAFQVYSYFQYKSHQYVHQVIKVLTASVSLQLIGSVLHFVDWATFANLGYNMLFFVYAAQVFDVLAMVCFMILLFLLAQGWTISNLNVQYVGFITCFALSVAAFRIGFFAWRYQTYHNSESVKYIYATPPMFAYGSLLVVVGLAYAVQCFLSFRQESVDVKRRLYIALGAMYSFWFLTPLLTILLAEAVAEYYRDVFAEGFVASVNGVAYLVMVGMMYPKWAHHYFNLKVGLDAQSMLINQTGDYRAVSAGISAGTQEDEL